MARSAAPVSSSLGYPRTVGVAVAVGAVGVLPGFMLGALALQVRADLELGITAFGATVAAFFVAAAVGSGPLGKVGERVGATAAMRAASAVAGLSLLSIAFLARSPASLVAILVVAGAGNALAQPATNLFLARRVIEHHQGLVFGVKQSSIPAAILLSGLSVPVAALAVGWRPTFAAAGVLALLVSLAIPSEPAPHERTGRARGRTDLPRRTLVLLAVAGACSSAGPNALGAYFVASSVDAGIPEPTAGLLLALGSVLSLVVRVVVGWMADRRRRQDFGVIVGLLAVGSVGFGLLAAQQPLALAVGGVLAFALGWGWPGLFHYAVVSANRSAPAAATGITQSGIYVGAAAGPAAFGLIAGRASFAAAWLASAALMLVAAVIVASVTRRGAAVPAPA
jgi:predicted MFS family arabinose efflux permease